MFRQRYTLAGGATILKMVMSMKSRPTAIFFADPLLAVGAVKQAHALHISIPEDISIIGFDDTDLRFGVHPTLTSVCQDAGARLQPLNA
ncbi:MAG: substrate-binding domain-containing protein [Phycisphaerae bacterium]